MLNTEQRVKVLRHMVEVADSRGEQAGNRMMVELSRLYPNKEVGISQDDFFIWLLETTTYTMMFFSKYFTEALFGINETCDVCGSENPKIHPHLASKFVYIPKNVFEVTEIIRGYLVDNLDPLEFMASYYGVFTDEETTQE